MGYKVSTNRGNAMAASTAPVSKSGLYADPREDWLALHSEAIIEPDRPLVDPHHHLWDRGGQRYLIEEMAADIASGHNIVATVYVDCRSMYRARGPEAFRPVGEVEFANGVAAMSASGGYSKAAICAGIVSHAHLLLGDSARALAALRRSISASTPGCFIPRSASSPTSPVPFPTQKSCSTTAAAPST